MNQTIFALATAPGRAAVAIIRLSGRGVRQALNQIGATRLKPRQASLRTFVNACGEPLDTGLAIWFPAPRSYTGEDCGELQIHGGVGVVDSISRALVELGLRPAEAGEFTRRAVENGRLDLGQAEAIGDLIDAESRGQSRQAINQLNGALGRRYQDWRTRLIRTLADLEAAVDFPDEDLPSDVMERAAAPLRMLLDDLNVALSDGARGRQVREGFRVAFIGAPNAGKSSLFNALLGRSAAIVSPTAGTTRDVIEAHIDLEGYRVIISDMAGLVESDDIIEAEGVRRARSWAGSADLRLWVVDHAGVTGHWRAGQDLVRQTDLLVLNKSDLEVAEDGISASNVATDMGLEMISASHSPREIDDLRTWLSARVGIELSGTDFPATTRLRHAALLTLAKDHVGRAVQALGQPELAAEDVRLAVRALARVTGTIGVDDVLDEVFASFCIGK